MKKLIALLESKMEKATSYWNRGVYKYAIELVNKYMENNGKTTDYPCLQDLLNGASSWLQYSEGGCALIYDEDIAKRLCSPSELKKVDSGLNPPNKKETWLQVQARALYQASEAIFDAILEL